MSRMRILAIALLLLATACSEEDHPLSGMDSVPPVITIVTPTAGQSVGANIRVYASIQDQSLLREAVIRLVPENLTWTNSSNAQISGKTVSGYIRAPQIGSYYVSLEVVDIFDNKGTSTNLPVTVAAVPEVAIDPPWTEGVTRYTNATAVRISGTSTILAGAAISSNVLQVSGPGATNVYFNTSGGAWFFDPVLAEGMNAFSFTAWADNGTASQPLLFNIVRDTVRPVLTIAAPSNNQEVGLNYVLQGTVSDALSGTASVTVVLDNGSPLAAAVSDNRWRLVVSNVQALGLHTNRVYARDRAGNWSLTNQVRVERAAVPWVMITLPQDGQTTGLASITVSGSSGIDGGHLVTNIQVRNNGGSWVTASGTSGWSISNFSLAQGTNLLEARAVANNGKTALSAGVLVHRPEPSGYSGMGAMLHGGGATFRVWAPNAESVSVAGSFNGWNSGANYMASEGNGYWSVFVPGITDGVEYKYVFRHQGNTIWRNDPFAREVTSSVGNSIVKNREYVWSPFTIPGHHETVIYELHVKTWTENIAGGGSRFAKVASKAGYLKDTLAVNAVKIMPAAEFPGDYSWGYNPAHPFAVESSYGGYTEYKNMVDALHQNGIAVIQDVVHNHYGPSDLDLWCFDGPDFGNGGIYFYTDWRKSTPWGDTRPDYGRGEVRSYIKDNAVYWIDEMGCDGLRWDATVYIRRTSYDGDAIEDGRSLLWWANDEVYKKKSGALTIAEDLQNDSSVTQNGGCNFRSQWYADFLHTMRTQLKLSDDSWRDMNALAHIIGFVDNGEHTRLVKYVESHDECAGKNGKQRLIEDIWSGNARSYYSMKRASLGVLAAIFSPGIPMIFQGQENLEWGNWDDTVNFSWDDVALFTQSSNNYIGMIGDAIRLKRNWNDNTRGLRGNGINVWHVNNTGKVIAFHRWMSGGAGDDVVVIINFSNTRYENYVLGGMPGDPGGEWKLRYNSDWHGTYVDWEGKFSAEYPGYIDAGNRWASGGTITFNIGAYSVLVYSQ